MGIRHLLVHVDSTDRSSDRMDLAVALARRFGARLVGLFAESRILGGSLLGERSPDQFQAAAVRARDNFGARVAAAGVDSEWWALPAAEKADLLAFAAAACRYVDFSILGQHEEDSRAPAELAEAILLESGRPVLVVPSVGRHLDVGRRVVVGWNASRESARALNEAIPLMAEAQEVTVLAFQEPSHGAIPGMPHADVVAHLALHGIEARYERSVRDKEGVGPVDTLLNYGFEIQADLTVVGATSHAFPARHAGTAARELLRQMPTPLFLVS